MKYFDAHTHANFAAYADDRPAVIARAKEAGVGMNTVGTQLDTSTEAVELAGQYDNVWATVGLHPIHTTKSYHDTQELGEGGKEFTSRGEVFDAAAYEILARNPRTIAIGVETNRRDPNHAILQRARRDVERLRDQDGQSFAIVELPMPHPLACGPASSCCAAGRPSSSSVGCLRPMPPPFAACNRWPRSEEHTSELQSH